MAAAIPAGMATRENPCRLRSAASARLPPLYHIKGMQAQFGMAAKENQQMNCEVTVHIAEFDPDRVSEIEDELIDGVGRFRFDCCVGDDTIDASANGFVGEATDPGELPRLINEMVTKANGGPCAVEITLELSREFSELEYHFDESTGPAGTLLNAIDFES